MSIYNSRQYKSKERVNGTVDRHESHVYNDARRGKGRGAVAASRHEQSRLQRVTLDKLSLLEGGGTEIVQDTEMRYGPAVRNVAE